MSAVATVNVWPMVVVVLLLRSAEITTAATMATTATLTMIIVRRDNVGIRFNNPCDVVAMISSFVCETIQKQFK
jgi:urease gamma subunit